MRIDKRPSRLRQNKRLGLKQIRDIASAISLIWFSIHWERFLCQAECRGYFFKISSTAATFRVIMFVCPGRMSAFIMTSVRIPFSAK